MLILLSPAKALDFDTPVARAALSEPRLLDQAEQLAAVMKTKTVAELARLSAVSDEIAALNAQRWADFAVPFPPGVVRPAILGFNGDAYQGMDARNRFSTTDFTEAQKTVRILSGLYGVLRPLDAMLAYRLEMGTKLATDRGGDLYRWWGDRITTLLAADLADSPGSATVINLASQEYFTAVRPELLGGPVISPRFEDTDAHGRRKVLSYYAKRARGEMAAWLILNRVRSPRRVVDFDVAGYRYDPASSTQAQPVFVRAFADR